MNVEAYLRRINYKVSRTVDVNNPNSDFLRDLHLAHLYAVPFENLDIHIGREIICDETRILHKIVDEHRGGFCYELNAAFAALLRALGFRVTMLSARVGRQDGSLGPEFDHLALRVDLDEPWLADVGFGEGFVEPLRLNSRLEQPQHGRLYRLNSLELPNSQQIGLDEVLSLQVMFEGKWKTEYAFKLRPCELCDFEGMCHHHQTSTESYFTRQRICSLATPEGRITLSDEKLIETQNGSRHERRIADNDVRRIVLRERFGVIMPGRTSPSESFHNSPIG
jgi:N-hydroxyarylamine O-acetyltransferase